LGGHSHTVEVTAAGRLYSVDTGFVVFNETTYPNFVELLKRLGVSWQPANMSFSITNAQTGMEFGFRTLMASSPSGATWCVPLFTDCSMRVFPS
jgi:predicted NAD/FAD-binding protein